MKRKILSTIIALTLCFVSAFATNISPDNNFADSEINMANNLTLTPIDKADLGSPKITFSEAPMINLQDVTESIIGVDTVDDFIANKEVVRAILQDFIVNDITVKPLIICMEDQGIYSINQIYRQAHRWVDNQPRFQTLYLTQEETIKFYNEISNAIDTLSAQHGKTYYFIGWDFSTQIYVQAERPQSITWTPSKQCITGTDERTLKIPYKTTVANIQEFFQITADDLYIRKPLSVRGGFFFLYPTGPNAGKQGSLAISAGFTTNSDL